MSTQRNVIAIVGDDPGMRALLEQLLLSLGYTPEVYASGEEFLRAAATSKAVCVVVDVLLGDITGVEMAGQLSVDGFKFPIAFMTGSTDVTLQRQAMDLGCIAYLEKPFP